VPSAGDGDVGEDGVDDRVGRDALHLGLRAELDTVPERGEGERLHVVRGDVVAAGQPGPGAGRGEQRGGAAGGDAEGEGRRLAGGAADVHDVGGDLGGDRRRGDGGAGRFEVGRGRHGADSGVPQVARV